MTVAAGAVVAAAAAAAAAALTEARGHMHMTQWGAEGGGEATAARLREQALFLGCPPLDSLKRRAARVCLDAPSDPSAHCACWLPVQGPLPEQGPLPLPVRQLLLALRRDMGRRYMVVAKMRGKGRRAFARGQDASGRQSTTCRKECRSGRRRCLQLRRCWLWLMGWWGVEGAALPPRYDRWRSMRWRAERRR